MVAFWVNGAKIDIFSYICPTKGAKCFVFWVAALVVQRIERRFPKP